MSNKSKLSRRHFLSAGGFLYAGLSASPFELLLNSMCNGFINQAKAEEFKQLGARNYINIALPGAPLRYQFDQWVRTNANDPEVKFSLMTASKYLTNSKEITGVNLGYFNYNNTLVPHLFTQSITTSEGEVPLTQLLNNMLVIRGYGTGLDGHTTNIIRQMTTLGGAPSLSGLSVDSNDKIFSAIQWPGRGDFSSFASLQGKALATVIGNKPAHSLLEGFAPPAKDKVKSSQLISRNQEAFDLAKARLMNYINSDQAGSKILAKNHSNAVALMKKGVANLEGFWAPAVLRYKTCIEASIRTLNIPEISDKEIIPQDNEMWQLGSGTGINPSSEVDFRTSIAEATLVNYAEGLALCEYMLIENLSSTVEIYTNNLTGLNLRRKKSEKNESYHLAHDMHSTGAYPAVFLMNQFYRGFSAGLLELINQLKKHKSLENNDLWSETVIQVISDFGRSARANGSGSDHGFNQMISSVFSGAIHSGPFVVGNVLKSSQLGSQALAAPIEGYNQKGPPAPTMMASTVASLLRLPNNPFANVAEPLVVIQNGQIILKYPGKMIDG